jgi:hypothetical protein
VREAWMANERRESARANFTTADVLMSVKL